MGASEKSLADHGDHVAVTVDEVDTAARLGSGDEPIDPVVALRIRRKIDRHVMPLVCILNFVQFMDKSTLANAAILGILKDTHLTANDFNWLSSIFFIGYFAFIYPQNLALQHFPVAKWMSLNVFIWAVILCCTIACKNFSQLMGVRFLLGIVEGTTTAALMILIPMFYTRKEQAIRVGYWYLMTGVGVIVAGFISYGTLHIKNDRLKPWQWLMLINGIITIVTAVLFFWLVPDSPLTAKFLTEDEKRVAIRRLKANQTGVENKHFKREQMMEALRDPKCWLFALWALFDSIPKSLTNQRQLIVNQFGFSVLQTTLLGCADGAINIAAVWGATAVAGRLPRSRAYIAAACYLPALLGIILVNTLPWHNKVGLLLSYEIVGIAGGTYPVMIGWLPTVNAGHTKRVTANAMLLVAYCIGYATSPFMWQAKYRPRNHIPWGIVAGSFALAIITLLAIRALLAAENRRRDKQAKDGSYEDAYLEVVSDEGVAVNIKVDKEFLDLTDKQNQDFRYVF